MDIVANIDHQKRLVQYRISGTLDLEELKAVVIDQKSGYFPINSLWDLRQAETADISMTHMQEIMRLAKTIGVRKGGKTAVVVGTEEDYPRFKKFEALMSADGVNLPMTVRVFRTIEDAGDWIEG